MTSAHPYAALPSEAFWRPAVADLHPLDVGELFEPKFAIGPDTRIALAGSCFAQHLGRFLKDNGYRTVDAEPPPPLLDPADHATFGFDTYSARYGNVYSARQLLQLFERAAGTLVPIDEAWTDGERWYDPYRPTIEPRGFASLEELRRCRTAHLSAVERILPETDVFVFTFGVTEAWRNKWDGVVYPSCPGTIHGDFDVDDHEFVNFSYPDVLADFEAFVALARGVNPALEFVVTVSPVPLTATASGRHVLTASMASKSILRAVAGELSNRYDCIDYFPSYEMIAAPSMRGMFFNPDMRTVTRRGVAHVMNAFADAHRAVAACALDAPDADDQASSADDAMCEEAILSSFVQ